MPPLDRRRRRRISRSSAIVAAVVVIVLLCVLLVAGGIAKTGRASYGYWRDVNRSYAAQATIVVEQSKGLRHELSAFVPGMAGETRTEVQATLDTLVRGTSDLARDARTLASPAPSEGVGREVAGALADRALAVTELRTVVDRIVGMSPLPVPGSPDPSSISLSAPRPISPTAAEAALGRVAALLTRADRAYASARRALLAAPGHAFLPQSVWAAGGALTEARLGSVAPELEASVTLAPVQRVVLVDHALAVTPEPVPTATGAAGPEMLPPTTRLSLTAVVANDGNVPERRVVVTAVAQPNGGGPASRGRRTLAVAAGGSVAVELPPLPVVPGRSYTVSVTVSPGGTAPATATSDSLAVTVAPPSPPVVTGLTPGHGRRRGATRVTIFGTGFVAVTGVRFGPAQARYRVVSTTEIIAVAPAGSGTVAVVVANPGGTSARSPADRFAYTSASATSKARRVDRRASWS